MHGAGIELAAISYDSPEILAAFAEERGISFPLLSDPGSHTIDAYGVRNRNADAGRTRGIPHPGTVLIDSEGVIRGKLFYAGYIGKGNARLITHKHAGPAPTEAHGLVAAPLGLPHHKQDDSSKENQGQEV